VGVNGILISSRTFQYGYRAMTYEMLSKWIKKNWPVK